MPDDLMRLAERKMRELTPSMLQALADFEPGMWYGTACPTKRAAAHKGHMVRMGLAEHDGAAPVSLYRLTPLGEEIAAALRAKEQTK